MVRDSTAWTYGLHMVVFSAKKARNGIKILDKQKRMCYYVLERRFLRTLVSKGVKINVADEPAAPVVCGV
jgi:hypothetical protein